MITKIENRKGTFLPMSPNDRKSDIDRKEILEKYNQTFYKDLHGWRDYELTSKGYEEWYYDCLPDDKQAKILDIGCGDGKFLFFMQQKGYQKIEGLELSAQQADGARKNVNCPIHVVDDTESFLFEKSNTYQIITMNDVLEHVPKNETVRFLKAVHDAIRPGGIAVINVPQISGFTSMFCRYNDFTHETIFTEMSLKQVLFLAGFSNVKFIPQKWRFKWTPSHLAYRLARFFWYALLKIIYTIESPGERHPGSFQVRLVVSASRSVD
jgi:2-polyprenyl-3-methyl-5-hydroxy-6-metoxy-1,4-benzoquinol methylase